MHIHTKSKTNRSVAISHTDKTVSSTVDVDPRFEFVDDFSKEIFDDFREGGGSEFSKIL